MSELAIQSDPQYEEEVEEASEESLEEGPQNVDDDEYEEPPPSPRREWMRPCMQNYRGRINLCVRDETDSKEHVCCEHAMSDELINRVADRVHRTLADDESDTGLIARIARRVITQMQDFFHGRSSRRSPTPPVSPHGSYTHQEVDQPPTSHQHSGQPGFIARGSTRRSRSSHHEPETSHHAVHQTPVTPVPPQTSHHEPETSHHAMHQTPVTPEPPQNRSNLSKEFKDQNPASRKRKTIKEWGRGRRKKATITVNSESDFVSSESSDYEFTVLEEERDATRLCKRSNTNLRSSSSLKMSEEEKLVPLKGKRPGRKGKQKVVDLNIETGKQVCGICLSEEGKKTVKGVLNCCSHYFCFACIMEWSKVESRCPLCKQRFTTISRTARTDGGHDLRDAVFPVPERDQVYRPSEEDLRGYLQPTSPASGSGAFTLHDRRRIQRVIHRFLNSRSRQPEGNDGVASASAINLFGSPTGRRVIATQNTIMPRVAMAPQNIFRGRLADYSTSSLYNRDVLQSQPSTSNVNPFGGLSQSEYAGINARIGGDLVQQQLHPCSTTSNTGADASTTPF